MAQEQNQKDPVCGMTVNPKQSSHQMDLEHKHYIFCSQQCLEKFKKNPEQYTH
jgi:P-type Cu+ transporter